MAVVGTNGGRWHLAPLVLTHFRQHWLQQAPMAQTVSATNDVGANSSGSSRWHQYAMAPTRLMNKLWTAIDANSSNYVDDLVGANGANEINT